LPLAKGEHLNRETGLLDKEGSPLKIKRSSGPARAKYFYRLRDDRITEFCVENAVGPQEIVTLRSDGNHIRWTSYWEGDLLVFYVPDGVDPSLGIFWSYDKRLQVAVPYPREELERRALNMRVSMVKREIDN